MLFYLYEYCYSLLAVIVTNVGEILQMEIFQITFKLPPLWPMLFVMESCPYFVWKSFCFSMFSVYLNWIDNGIQTDIVLEYLQEFNIFSRLIIFMRSYYQNEGGLVNRSYLTSPVVSALNLRKWSHKMCFTQIFPGAPQYSSTEGDQPGLMWN